MVQTILQQDTVDMLDKKDQLLGCLYQMEIDRVKFLLASYLRVRLHKVSTNIWSETPIMIITRQKNTNSSQVLTIIIIATAHLQRHYHHEVPHHHTTSPCPTQIENNIFYYATSPGSEALSLEEMSYAKKYV